MHVLDASSASKLNVDVLKGMIVKSTETKLNPIGVREIKALESFYLNALLADEGGLEGVDQIQNG